ncbi:hypothetical protein GC170_00420 [bacterium]|nr:hypothetical protein [bacterium]
MTDIEDKDGKEMPTGRPDDMSPVATAPQGEQDAYRHGKPMSFAERVRRERRPLIASDPFAIAGDMEAGVRLFEGKQDRLMMIKFEEKPGSEVLNRMKEYGFRWNPRDMVWVHPVRPDNEHSIRVEARRLYQEVRSMLREAKGIENNQEIPF